MDIFDSKLKKQKKNDSSYPIKSEVSKQINCL
jgi:hypothetical protein